MNKKLFIFLPLIALLTGCSGKKSYPCSEYFTHSVKWKDETKDFKVLQLCDIHMSQSDKYDEHFKVINKTIKQADPNLIVINGDAFTFADKRTVKRLFMFIDSYDIPWTYAYGNHDDQGYYPDTFIQRLLKDDSTYKNVIFKNIENDKVTGRSNFAINIEKYDLILGKDATKFQVYLFDSHSYNFDTFRYDFIKQDQIDWYRSMVEYSKEKFGGGTIVPSAMYFHIPLPEFLDAWNNYKDGKEDAKLLIEGATNEEGCSAPDKDSDLGLFNVVKELGATKAICCGHDHINDTVIKYQDVDLCYGVSATDRIYYDENKVGGQVLNIDKDTFELSYTNIYVNYDNDDVKVVNSIKELMK